MTIRTEADDQWLTQTAADTGSGIAPDLLKHLFEPGFVTTGTRVRVRSGLYTSYAIVQKTLGRYRGHQHGRSGHHVYPEITHLPDFQHLTGDAAYDNSDSGGRMREVTKRLIAKRLIVRRRDKRSVEFDS
ncbi:MAG: ATP-binding protein [Gemmatimonadota bacterium]|nr:ATP-binding protein [Gemmatimonadota bacterium]